LSFLDYNELPLIVPDFEKEFISFINPVFNQLSKYYDKIEQQAIVEDTWKTLAILYIKRKDFSGGATSGLTGG
jgi:hypothetical protein